MFNTTGQPAMSVPLYWNQEMLPVGMQFAARFDAESTLVRLAWQLERAQPWSTGFHWDCLTEKEAKPACRRLP